MIHKLCRQAVSVYVSNSVLSGTFDKYSQAFGQNLNHKIEEGSYMTILHFLN